LSEGRGREEGWRKETVFVGPERKLLRRCCASGLIFGQNIFAREGGWRSLYGGGGGSMRDSVYHCEN